jgi:hypothetical protein
MEILMGYLSIKHIHKDNIKIHHSHPYYSLSYRLDYLKLSSISLKVGDVSIREDKGYYITVADPSSIHDLLTLDNYLSEHIHNYKPLLHTVNSVSNITSNPTSNPSYYIYLKHNVYLDTFMKTFIGKDIYINIIKLKKTASHTFPIVYVL